MNSFRQKYNPYKIQRSEAEKYQGQPLHNFSEEK